MKKTLMIAGALLSLGVGSAFAAETNGQAQQAQAAQTAQVAQQSNGQHLLFATSSRPTTSVYSLFADPGTTQGGEH